MLRRSLIALLCMVVGVALATAVGEALAAVLGGGLPLRLLQQLLIALVLACGLAISAWNASASQDFRAALLAGAVLVVVEIGLLFLALLERLPSAQVDSFVQKSFLALGLYPKGADVWLPLGLVFWLASVLVVIGVAVALAQMLRYLQRRRGEQPSSR